MSFKDAIKKTYSDIKRGTVKVADEIKAEYKKAQLNKELDEMYRTLGRIRYTELIEETDAEDETTKIVVEIGRIERELSVFGAAADNEGKCPVCGKKIGKGEYCPYCGVKHSEEV